VEDQTPSKNINKIGKILNCDPKSIHIELIKTADHGESLMILANHKKYYLKSYLKKNDPFKLSLSKEIICQSLLSKEKLAPKVLYTYDEKVIICEWVDNLEAQLSRDELIESLVRSIIIKNNLPLISVLPTRDLNLVTHHYYLNFVDRPILPALSGLLDLFKLLGSVLNRSSYAPVICHGDLSFSNCIFTEKESLFCDLEYACIGSPFIDISSVIVQEEISPNEANILAGRILNMEMSTSPKNHLSSWIQFTLLINTFWSILYDKDVIVGSVIKNLEINLKRYSTN
jgi:hypothetical protein